jgi:cytochrome c oxidase accessory protein FixG
MSKLPTHDISPDPVKVHTPHEIDLYARRQKIHARSIAGFFQNIRKLTIWVSLGIFFLLPWVNWDGRQALLFDLPDHRFYIFWWTFLPQDFVFLSWLLIISALSLFAVTVFAGRVWCGYTCPQTVWTTVFMWVEELTEGNRNARIRLDKSPFSINKLVRRGLKHSGWILVALATGLTFVGYFTPVHELYREFRGLELGFWEIFWIFFFTAATYLNAGWMREQVCMYMCPYGRFQSVMFDRDTLIISYDSKRGDPRGSRKRGTDYAAEGLGSCIDCELCVQVCPTGIDIRDGLQFECIQCAACVDACDSIMDQMGYARGLVRYTTENALESGSSMHFLRPRLIGYALVLTVMGGLFLYALGGRVPLTVEAIRDRNQLYRESSDGNIENVYTLKIMNESQHAVTYTLKIEGDRRIHEEASDPERLTLGPGELRSVPITLEADPGQLDKTKYTIHFIVKAADDDRTAASTESRFLAPALR